MRPEGHSEAVEWLRFALEDLEGARVTNSARRTAPRLACYHAQQAVEKALKAALVVEGIAPPRHHNLEALRALLPALWGPGVVGGDLSALTLWAVQARYPSDFPAPTASEARAAVRQATTCVNAIVGDLALRGVVLPE